MVCFISAHCMALLDFAAICSFAPLLCSLFHCICHEQSKGSKANGTVKADGCAKHLRTSVFTFKPARYLIWWRVGTIWEAVLLMLEVVAVRALAALDAINFELLCYVKPIKPFNRTRKTTVVIWFNLWLLLCDCQFMYHSQMLNYRIFRAIRHTG